MVRHVALLVGGLCTRPAPRGKEAEPQGAADVHDEHEERELLPRAEYAEIAETEGQVQNHKCTYVNMHVHLCVLMVHNPVSGAAMACAD